MAMNVIITGCGRGGTSLAAGSIAGSPTGYYMGDNLVEAREANPRGFFESRHINALNEQIMAPAVAEQTGPHVPQAKQMWLAHLPLDIELTASNDVQQQIQTVTRHQPFCFKDPRFAYTLDVWRPHLARTAFVCVFRDPAVTAASIIKEVQTAPYLASLAMNEDHAMEVWTQLYEHVLHRHRGRGAWMFVHVNQLFDTNALEQLERHIESPVDRRFPEPSLQRTQSDRPTPPHTTEVYRTLCELAHYSPTPTPKAGGA